MGPSSRATNLKRLPYIRTVMTTYVNKKRVDTKSPCTICLSPIADTNSAVTECGHNFHLHCICKHMFLSYSGQKCPICRAALPDIRQSGSSLHTAARLPPPPRTPSAFLHMQGRRTLNTIIERRIQAGRRLHPIPRPDNESEKTRKMRRLKRMLESDVSY
jgi:hypothetical protein